MKISRIFKTIFLYDFLTGLLIALKEVFKPKKEAYIKMRKAASRIQKVFENDLNIQDLIL